MADESHRGEGRAAAPAPPTTAMAALAWRPAEARAEILRDLHRRAGNGAIARLLAAGDATPPACPDGQPPSGPVS